jgi:murein DD-endopeptidase MepM/ murein hydrolase activator NlpD
MERRGAASGTGGVNRIPTNGGTLRLSTETTARRHRAAAAIRTHLRRAIDRLVPERQIILRTERRLRAVVLTQRAQLAVLAVLAAIVGWTAYATAAYVFDGAIVAAKNREIGAVRVANAALRDEMRRSEQRFAVVTGRLEAKHAYLLGLMERTGGGKTPAAKTPAPADGQSDRLVASRTAVSQQLTDLTVAPKLISERPLATGGIGEALHDRSRIQAESSRLTARLSTIDERLSELHVAQQSAMTKLARRALTNLDDVRAMIAGLGLDVARVLGRTAARPQSGVGGPFVPASPSDASPAVQAGFGAADRAVARWEGVQQALRSLPLGAPIPQVSVMSPFGRRVDPFNGLAAFHSGVDLGGAMGMPVHATAPGRVTFAGTNGGYGRMVEIDHGQGLVTRYAHLSRLMVRPGDRVHYGQTIGLMGTSGRSTGVHVHYEVLVDGKPRDPMKFIQAGSYVFVQR